nr:peptidylprolyl isomerase [Pseudenhygromyxa sp. WMMC2535]
MRALAREPLIHFGLLGLAIFGLYRLVDPEAGQGERVVVGESTLARIEAAESRRLGHPPTDEERDAALRAWADTEILYREARALGLDRGDPIVRRRLVQKMRFWLEERSELPEPDDAALEAWIAAHAERFERGPRAAFTHVFVRSSSRVVPEAKLAEYEQALAEGADPATLGEAFALGQVIAAKSTAELERQFGPGFGEALLALEDDGRWHRLRSIYGWHLVHIDDRLSGRLATVDEVRSQARGGLLRDAREQAVAAGMDELRARYELVLPEDA